MAECNEINQRLRLRSFQGGAKVQIIWMAEYLGQNANRLLKLIEEPPAQTHIILICEDLDKMLNTVISRCQLFRVPRIETDFITSYLMKNHAMNAERAEALAGLSEGNMSLVLEYLAVNSHQMLDVCLEWLKICKSGNALRLRDWVDSFNDYNLEEKKAILQYLLRIIREGLHRQQGVKKPTNLDPSQVEKLKEDNGLGSLTVDQIGELGKIVSRVINWLDRNVHPKILLFHSSLEMEQVLNE